MSRKQSIWRKDITRVVPFRYRWIGALLLAALWAVFIVSECINLPQRPVLETWGGWLFVAFNVVVFLSFLAYANENYKAVRHMKYWGTGRCYRCDYDLRGCTSVSCPECGAYFGTRKHPPAEGTGEGERIMRRGDGSP